MGFYRFSIWHLLLNAHIISSDQARFSFHVVIVIAVRLLCRAHCSMYHFERGRKEKGYACTHICVLLTLCAFNCNQTNTSTPAIKRTNTQTIEIIMHAELQVFKQSVLFSTRNFLFKSIPYSIGFQTFSGFVWKH